MEDATGNLADETGMMPAVENEQPVIDDSPSAPSGHDGDADRAARPHGLPEKFWDDERGEIRAEALANSYISLEQKLGATEPTGVPTDPTGYEINLRSDAFGVDETVNERLHGAGFTQDQAQLVYDLAGEYLSPMLAEMGVEFATQSEIDKLAHHYGGEDRWREMSSQILKWGKANLSDEVFNSMTTSMEGVKALHQMMSSDEPSLVHDGQAVSAPDSEESLRVMMRDPRYWRDHDPAIVERVKNGFQRLYPDEG